MPELIADTELLQTALVGLHQTHWLALSADFTRKLPRIPGRRHALSGPFLVHYLDALVYPNVSEALLISFAIAVCGANLYFHVRRMRRHSF